MSAVALGHRRWFVLRERVHAAALVHLVAIHVGLVPGALRNHYSSGDDAGRHLRLDANLANRTCHGNQVAVFN